MKLVGLLFTIATNAAMPREALPFDAPEWPVNYRLHFDGAAKVKLTEGVTLSLDAPEPHDEAVEHPAKSVPVLRVWSGGKLVRGPEEMTALARSRAKDSPVVKPVIESGTGWVQALERSDHAEIVGAWNDLSLAGGAQIYQTLCVVCHGTREQPGSLPTALRFAEAPFKNGADPFSTYLTLTKGFDQMVPQGQYTTAQKYAVIQYIRETFLKPHNRSQFIEVTPAYIASLPRGLARAEAEQEDTLLPPYQRMELGNALFWTLQIAPGIIAQKAIAVRLDDGPGGVTKGRAWMIYDHDTMRVAAASTGDFVDWKGVAFDGSHGTHTSLTGEKLS